MFLLRSSFALAVFFVAFLYVMNGVEARIKEEWDEQRQCVLKDNRVSIPLDT